MDSLIQFATQQLLSSPSARAAPMLPVTRMEHLPPTKIQDLHELIAEDESPTERPKHVGNLMSNRKKPNAAFSDIAPYYISGIVMGGILAIVVGSALSRSTR
jgi:hypothetical protein